MKHRTTETLPGLIMTLAVRPQGVNTSEVTAIRGGKTSDVAKAMKLLETKGYLSRPPKAHPKNASVAQCTPEQLASYLAKGAPPPKKPQPVTLERRVTTLSINPKRIAGRAPWTKDAPPHLPYDDAGKPLFKVTVCPGFTGNPVRTNTHSGAY